MLHSSRIGVVGGHRWPKGHHSTRTLVTGTGKHPCCVCPRSYLAFEMTTTINPDDRLDAGAAVALLPGIAYALGVHDADETLTLLADALRERRALHGLCWHDAVNVAAAIAFDCSARYDVADYLALRAIRARDGSDAMPWRDRQAVAALSRCVPACWGWRRDDAPGQPARA